MSKPKYFKTILEKRKNGKKQVLGDTGYSSGGKIWNQEFWGNGNKNVVLILKLD